MKNILIITGSELHHDFFCNSLITNFKEYKFTILKIGSERTDFDFYFSIFSNGLKDSDFESKKKVVDFIFNRNKNLCLKENPQLLKAPNNKKIFRNSLDLHNELEIILSKNTFDLVLTYGSPIIKNYEILNMKSYNIHNGLSRYYRGGISNFYALSKNEFEKVGITCHKLTSKIDAGDVLFEINLDKGSYKNFDEINYFLLKEIIKNITNLIKNNSFDTYTIPKGELILVKSFTYEMLIKIMENINNFK